MRGLRAACSCPRARSPARREAIAGEGAEVVVVDGTYEDAVRARGGRGRASRACFELADVGASGPAEWVIDGYATLFDELEDAVRRDPRPDRRRLAGRRRGALRARRRASTVVGVEPDVAACLTAALQAGEPVEIADAGHDDGRPRLRDRLGGRLAVAAAPASAARSRSPTPRRTRRWRELADAGLAIGESGAAPLAALPGARGRAAARACC